MTGFAPGEWSWANLQISSSPTPLRSQLVITETGLYTVSLWMREDGLRLDRLLLTTDESYTPTGFGPPEANRLTDPQTIPTPLTHTIVYTYDDLYRLTEADYSTGDSYAYDYDPVGNRLQQIINGDTTDYLYDAANRLEFLNGQAVYTFDANGNLLNSDTLTNTFDAANRLTSVERSDTRLEPIYNGVGDRIGQTVGTTTTNLALDVIGLPEVIYTSEGNTYLHLPGVIVAQDSLSTRYLLSDGLGSIRQASDEAGQVVSYHAFDPYGNPVTSHVPRPTSYAFTGEWWEQDLGLLHLRARWYAPETGTFLSRDPVESEPPYQYVGGNPTRWIDPSGMQGITPLDGDPNRPECYQPIRAGDIRPLGCTLPPECYELDVVNGVTFYNSTKCPLPPVSAVQSPSIERTRYLFAFEVIDVPCGVKLNPGGLGLKNDTASNALGVLGAGVDAYEGYTIFSAGSAQVPAFVDIGAGLVGSMAAGETYINESPHSELPSGVVLGQDFWVAAIDWGIALAADKALPALGTLVGGTVANADGPIPISEGLGYLVGTGAAKTVDTGLTGFGFYNDISRTPFNVEHQLVPPIPTWYAAGMMWEEIPFFVLLRYECPPTYCE